MNDIAHNLAYIRDKISAAATRCGRSSEEVTLLAVSKPNLRATSQKPLPPDNGHLVKIMYKRGGKNPPLSGSESGRPALALYWPLQSNKSRLVAEHFDWCHTIDRLRIASRLSEQRPDNLPALNVLIQINISDENSKSGIPLAELDELAAAVATLPRLRLRGLMAIPAPESDYVRQFEVARQMAVAFAGLKARYPDVDTLSLGMSDDMEAAIAAGSTMVRIGTAIFGARDYTKN